MDTGLTLHVGEDLEALAIQFATLLGEPSDNILEPLWTVVPSAPVRQWLDWHLSAYVGASSAERRDGVTANLAYLFPEEFVRRLEESALGDTGRTRTAWEPTALALRIMRLDGPRRSYESARQLADDIDEMVRWRPGMIRGTEPAPRSADDALRVYAQLEPSTSTPLAQRDAVREMLRGARPRDVPDRVFLFGVPNVPGGPEFAELVADLARHCAVHVLVPVPSVTRARVLLDGDGEDVGPLDGWFHEADETFQIWRGVGDDTTQIRFLETRDPGTSVLGDLRSSVRRGATHDTPDDLSVRVIGAVGRARQVEVARDAVLEAIATGIAPHEILVVTPDPASIAGSLERHWNHDRGVGVARRPRVPFELTEVDTASSRDRLHFSLAVLSLCGNYATREQLETLGTYPCFARTLLDSDDRLWSLADEANVTFGVSPAQRHRFDVYGSLGDASFRPDAGTWQRLVDRVAATMYDVPRPAGETSMLGVPSDLDAVSGLHALLRLLDANRTVRDAGSSTLSDWLCHLTKWINEVAPAHDDDSLESAVARVASWIDPAVASFDADASLSFGDFESLWRDVAAPRSQQRIFGRGGVTVTRLTSLTYAPYRMVCVIGLDESALPPAELRSPLLGPRRTGDPDARHALLGALLASVLSAEERLLVTWSSRREDNGRRVDPPIVLEELLAALSRATRRASTSVRSSSSRHGFSIPSAEPRVVATTFDAAYAAPPAPTSPPVVEPPSLADVSGGDLRTFLTNPARSYLRRTLGAALPPDALSHAVVPPVTLDHSQRARLQRRYVEELAAHYAADFAMSPPPYAPDLGDGDDADPGVARLRQPARELRARLLHDERSNANVPPRLWQHRMNFDVLDLAAYNLAVDLSEFGPLAPASVPSLFADVDLGDGTRLILAPDGAHARAFTPLRSLARDTLLATVTFEAREGGLAQASHVLRSVLDLLILRLNAPEFDAVAITYFLPSRAEAYKVKRRQLLAGEFPLNPRVTMRFDGEGDDARRALRTMVEWYRRSHEVPLPLFRRTSVASVVTGLVHKAAATWESGPYSFGEDRELAHELLFPYPYAELAELSPGESFPLARQLRQVLSCVHVSDVDQVSRAPGLSRRVIDPARWSDAEETFSPLVEASEAP